MARHHCDVSSGLCCPGVKPRRWPGHLLHASAQYPVYNEDLILIVFLLQYRKAFVDSQKQQQKVLKSELDALPKQQRKEVSKKRKEELEIRQKEEVRYSILVL